jgi:hypothetical protein
MEDWMKEFEERSARLREELNAADEVLVRGIVGPNGAGAGCSPDNPEWHMTFTLAAWRIAEGAIRRKGLTIEQNLYEKEFRAAQKVLRPYACVGLMVRLREENVFGSPRGLLTRLLGKDADRELKVVAEELQQPVIVTDPRFGEFTLDRSVNWYESRTQWGSETVRLFLACEDDDSSWPLQSLKNAQRLWAERQEWDRRVRECIVKSLLSLKNDGWLEEGEEPLEAGDFLSRLRLQSIGVKPYDGFEFWFDDGDLFWGHSIEVYGSFAEGLGEASIQG